MWYDLAAVAAILAAGNVAFHRFEHRTPKWRRILKTLIILAATAAISHWFGHKGVAIVFGLAAIPVVIIHAWWLPSKGINGWTGEPKEKYYALRGWTDLKPELHLKEDLPAGSKRRS